MTSREQHSGSKSLARLVPGLTRQAFAERGFHEAAVLTDWHAIVGEELAGKCAAIEFGRDGTLDVRAEGPTAIALQHAEPQILDRIATYFGFRAVKKLRLRQGPVAAREPVQRKSPTDDPTGAPVESMLDHVADAPLRAALHRLGSRMSHLSEND